MVQFCASVLVLKSEFWPQMSNVSILRDFPLLESKSVPTFMFIHALTYQIIIEHCMYLIVYLYVH